jgi:Dynamin family
MESIQASTSLEPAPVEGMSRKKHSLFDEIAPGTPFYNEDFQRAITKGREIVKDILKSLENMKSISQIRDMQELKKEAFELSRYMANETRIIGLVGKSGFGKSSLINSLLHHPEISPTNASGAACTSIVTEFLQSKPNQEAPILIEIERFSNMEINELIENAVTDYRRFICLEKELGSAESDDEQEDYDDLKRRAETAWSTLECAFGNRDKFSEELFDNQSISANQEITSLLNQWVLESVWPGSDGFIKTEEANNAEECSDKTSAYMEGNLWPFIKIIRVHLNCPILNAGIILVDLPGLEDTNLARIKAAESYLFRCDHFFVITEASRAITDQSLRSSLLHVLTKHISLDSKSDKQNPKFSIVCTKSDSISVKGLKREIKRLGTDEEREEFNRLNQLCESEDTGDVDPRMKTLLCAYRARRVREGVKSAYKKAFKGNAVEVFVLSNTQYDTGVAKHDIATIYQSGIPLLRRFCYTIAAGEQYIQYHHFLKTLVGGLLNRIQIWLEFNDETLADLFRQWQTRLDGEIEAAEKSVREMNSVAKGEARKRLKNAVLLNHRIEHCCTAALNKAEAHSKWHNSSYAAWCRHSGEYKTKSRGYINWNDEMIQKLRMELQEPIDGFKEDILQIFIDKIQKPFERRFNEIGEWTVSEEFPGSIKDGINFEKDKLLNSIRKTKHDFIEKVLLTIQLKATEGNASSFIRARMQPTYTQAAGMTGSGRFKRQIEAIGCHISKGNLFVQILQDLEMEAKKAIEDLFKDVMIITIGRLCQVKRTLQYAIEGDEYLRTDASFKQKILEARDQLSETVNQLKERYNSTVQPALDEKPLDTTSL